MSFSTGAATINGAPPSVLSPTSMGGFPVQQTNGQSPEIYANGIPHYPGECQLVDIGMSYFGVLLSPFDEFPPKFVSIIKTFIWGYFHVLKG